MLFRSSLRFHLPTPLIINDLRSYGVNLADFPYSSYATVLGGGKREESGKWTEILRGLDSLHEVVAVFEGQVFKLLKLGLGFSG